MSRTTMRSASAMGSPAFLALSCVGFIASAPAAAQDAPATGEKQLSGVTVTDTAIEDEGYKAERIESPKAIAPLLDTPRSVVVVDKQVIKDMGAATLVDALRTAPGITFGAAEGGNPIGDRPFIRGFDSQGSTYIDGVRDIGAQSREVFAVEQIQVVRGSDSTLGGRGSAGGSLNIISKLPQRETAASGAISYGNADYKRVTGDVNVRVSDMIGVRLNAMWHDQNFADRDAIFQKRWGIAPSITIGMEGPTKLTASIYYLDQDELPDSGIPFLYTIANTPNAGYSYSEPAMGRITTIGGRTGTVKRSTFYGLTNRDFRDAKTAQGMLRAEHDFGKVKLRTTFRANHNYQKYSFLLPDDSQSNVYGTSPTASATNLAAQGGYVWTRSNTRLAETDSLTNQTDFFGTFETGSVKHSFSTGFELSTERAERGALVLANGSTISPRCSPLAVQRFYCVDLFNPNPDANWINYTNDTATGVPTPITEPSIASRTINKANTISVYGFDSITLTEQLILNVGLRYDRFQSTSELPVAGNGRPVVSREDNLFNYQAGVIFKPTSNTSVYASYATAATPPNALIGEGQEQNAFSTIATIQNALKVEKTKSIEAGAKAELFNGGLSVSGAVFQTKTTNLRTAIDANTVAFIGTRRIRGFELGWTGNITDEWNVTGGYTYLDAKIVDGGTTAFILPAGGGSAGGTLLLPSVNTGRRAPQTAKNSFTFWSNYQIIPALSIGGGAFYTGRQFGGYQDNRAVVPATATTPASVSAATKILARTIPGYWRFDARASWKINDHFDIAVNAQNLTNKLYYTQIYTSHYASIAAGRTVFGTLNIKY